MLIGNQRPFLCVHRYIADEELQRSQEKSKSARVHVVERAREATGPPLPLRPARIDGRDGHRRGSPLFELDAVDLRARPVQVANNSEELLQRIR